MTDKRDVLLADGVADGVIDEVLGRLKSGKEANISLVRRGELVIAANVYKAVAVAVRVLAGSRTIVRIPDETRTARDRVRKRSPRCV